MIIYKNLCIFKQMLYAEQMLYYDPTLCTDQAWTEYLKYQMPLTGVFDPKLRYYLRRITIWRWLKVDSSASKWKAHGKDDGEFIQHTPGRLSHLSLSGTMSVRPNMYPTKSHQHRERLERDRDDFAIHQIFLNSADSSWDYEHLIGLVKSRVKSSGSTERGPRSIRYFLRARRRNNENW